MKNSNHKVEFLTGKEEICRVAPQLYEADPEEINKWRGLYDSNAGWAHSSQALSKAFTETQQLGARFIFGDDGKMISLMTSADGTEVVGIKVASGKIHTADRYVLAIGAATPAIWPETSSLLWSKCWALAHIKLAPGELDDLRNMPVIDSLELGYCFEPDRATGLMKICNASSGYQWRKGINQAGESYSIPRYASEHPEDGIPEDARNAIKKFIDGVLPRFTARHLVEERLCWDAETPDQHFLIDKHPQFSGGELIVATGGSAHAVKFFPCSGDML